MKIPHSLNVLEIQSPMGSVLAFADEVALYGVMFGDSAIKNIIKKMVAFHKIEHIIPGATPPLHLLERELQDYFSHELVQFTVPLRSYGTIFQNNVWNALKDIPYGTVCNYEEIACRIQEPLACRAVANASAANLFAIIIPCHRVIRKEGELGGYAAGVERKQWLIRHERRNKRL